MTVQTNQGQGNANPNQSTGGGKMKWYHYVLIAVGVLAILGGTFFLGRASAPNVAQQHDAPVQAPAAAPTPTPTTIAAPVVEQHDRVDHLVELDEIYRNHGLKAWLQAAGFTWEGVIQQARQVEEETIQLNSLPKIVASGVQLEATNFHANWPACFTTDQPYVLDTNGRSYKPDPNNPSVLVTNGWVSGTLTAYVDCSNWYQLKP